MFRLPLIVRRVRGVSMAPTLADGDYIIAIRLGPRRQRNLRPGDVVVIEPNADDASRSTVWRSLTAGSMIKRIDGGDARSGYTIGGDNSTSLSGESFGRIRFTDMVARVVLRVPKVGAVSRIRRQAGARIT